MSPYAVDARDPVSHCQLDRSLFGYQAGHPTQPATGMCLCVLLLCIATMCRNDVLHIPFPIQKVGVTAMLIASKYEEIWAPEVRDYVYISDKAYTRDQILSMEKIMLNTLGFKLTVPTPYPFLARFMKANDSHNDKEFANYAQYLVELALPEYGALKYSASLLAAAAVYATNVATNKATPFPHALAKHSSYAEEHVRACAIELARLHRKAPNASLHAVHKKWSHTKYVCLFVGGVGKIGVKLHHPIHHAGLTKPPSAPAPLRCWVRCLRKLPTGSNWELYQAQISSRNTTPWYQMTSCSFSLDDHRRSCCLL